MTTFYHQIMDAENTLKDLKTAYLRRWGWKETCHTPGSFWLWGRHMDDVNAQYDNWNREHPDKKHEPYPAMLVPMDLAVTITVSCIDKQEELGESNDVDE